eukprot:TRINITY_DN14963_c0_g1_i1.p1 TRINITY_DN14963_c0_g1~~TRINITY_DN14963_c0_g1_i1.p1  ORF type:complete len:224 (-),score=59.61 TRINITY_DN14963_c0_g1_i1:129-800(-)
MGLEESGSRESSEKERSLARAFWKETEAVHKKVEGHKYVEYLAKGELKIESYLQHLEDLSLVYETLEEEIRKNVERNLELEKIYFSCLERHLYIMADIQYLQDELNLEVNPSSAARRYAERLREIGENAPLCLVAHAYTRYMGDVSGGMILKRFLSKRWPQATNMYDFTDLLTSEKKTIKAFKDLYKERLDSIILSPEQFYNVVKEAHLAFELAEELFNAVPL